MLAEYIPEDRFNQAERAVVRALAKYFFTDPIDCDDEGIGGCAATGARKDGMPEVSTIHTKINRDDQDEPCYHHAETPAIGVSCTGQAGETPRTLRRNDIRITCVMDMVVFGGDIHKVDKDTARIAACAQSFVSHAMRQSKHEALDGYFRGATGGGTIESDGVVGLSVRYSDAGIIGEAATSFTLVVCDEGYTPEED